MNTQIVCNSCGYTGKPSEFDDGEEVMCPRCTSCWVEVKK